MTTIQDLEKKALAATKGDWTLDHNDTYVAAHIEGQNDWDWITGPMKVDDGYSYSEDEDLRGKNIQNNCRFVAAFNPQVALELIEKLRVARGALRQCNKHCQAYSCGSWTFNALAKLAAGSVGV